MQLEVFFKADVEFEIIFEDQHIFVPASDSSLVIAYDHKYRKPYELIIRCNNPRILDRNIEITKIMFDDFWQLEGNRTAIAKNVYDEHYISYAKNKIIDINYNVTNNNIMFFTGELRYKFYHPITDFIHALH
jgi:hypothetical protein